MVGELDAGNPHVQFDEGVQETCDSATRLCPTLPQPLASWDKQSHECFWYNVFAGIIVKVRDEPLATICRSPTVVVNSLCSIGPKRISRMCVGKWKHRCASGCRRMLIKRQDCRWAGHV